MFSTIFVQIDPLLAHSEVTEPGKRQKRPCNSRGDDMKTEPKKSTFGLMKGFQTLSARASRRMLCATLVLTLLPAAALRATTPNTVGTAFPLYVSSQNINGMAGIVKVDSSGNQTVFTSGGKYAFTL